MDVYEVDSSKRKESICFAAYANMRNSDGYCDYSFKDESFSFQLKEIGDQYYEKKKYRKAVSYFNKALCYAVKDSEIMEALYAKRSTLAVAIESIESKNDADNFFHLLCAPNVKSPFMMDSLQIIKDKKKKCLCLISKNDLMVGDVIAVQKPFASILVDHSLYKHCSNCMKESALKLIPCDVCVSVMFCSENCKIAGFEIHQHECRIVDELILKFDIKREIPYHRFRALFKALSLFDGSAEKMKEFLEGKDTTSKLSTLDLCNNEKLFLKVAYSLKYSDFEDQQIKPLYYSFYPKLIEIMTNPKMVSFIMNFMAKIPFSAVARRNTNFKNQRNGGYYQLQTVLDPSCAPNVLGIILNDCKIVYVVQHPIRAGEKITIT